MNTSERGVTLLDTMIGAMVVAIVVGLAYPGFMAANDTIATSGTRDRVERSADQILARLTSEFRGGQIVAESAAGEAPEITFARVSPDATLDDLDEGGEIPWAAETRILRFRETETISEALIEEDVNRDGDQTDNFVAGLLEIEEDGVARPITETGRVILSHTTYNGDLDGDGTGDPLFTRVDRQVQIEIHLLTRTTQGRLVTTAVRGAIRLRNAQN